VLPCPQVKLKDLYENGQLEQLLQYAQTTQLQCSLVGAAAGRQQHSSRSGGTRAPTRAAPVRPQNLRI
jgi:hypothetical protein